MRPNLPKLAKKNFSHQLVSVVYVFIALSANSFLNQFLCAFLHIKPLLKRGLPKWSKFFPFIEVPFQTRTKR